MEQQGTFDWMDVAQYFYIADERLGLFARQFQTTLEGALAGKDVSLSALPSYVGLPTGAEEGTYLALDFGGTNVRVSRIRLLGNHCFLIEKQLSKPLREPGKYDYTTADTSKEELFDFLAYIVGIVAGGNKDYALGHTFSFAVEQQGLGDAKLLAWAKEMAVTGVEGLLVNQLLREALVRRGLDKIRPAALVNDTTAALLASAYQHTPSNIGVICGTGFNMCYYEPERQMILNLEAGNYDGATPSKWDTIVDAQSLKPGFHVLEKMVSGAYLSEIYRQTIMSYYQTDDIPRFTTKDMNKIISTENLKEGRLFMSCLWKRIVSPEDVRPLRNIGAAIFVRSAQISGAAVYAVLRHLYGDLPIPEQTVAVEGSILEHVRGGLFMMEDAMRACQSTFGQKRNANVLAEPLVVKNGPSVGAAIAAAMVKP